MVEFHEPERARRRQASAPSSGPDLDWKDDRLICRTEATATPEERLNAAATLLSRLQSFSA